MLRLATDEDFNNRIVRGLLRRQPDVDILRVQAQVADGKPIVLNCWDFGSGH